MRGKRRRRLNGGKSTGPKTLDGVARIRAANSKHGRFSAEGKAVARWEKLYTRNGIRSLRQFAKESWDARAYLSRLLIEGETIPPALVEV